MKVLMITGDKNFKPGHERYDLQKAAVDEFAVIYWGRDSLWPNIPTGHFDVVTTQDPLLRGVFGLYAANKVRAQLNIQIHMDLQVLPWWKRRLARFVLSRADSIRVVSNKSKAQVERAIVRAKITVLPVFVDISRFQNIVQQSHAGKNILWVGRFEKEKSPQLAIDVLKEVLKSMPDAKLTLLGAGSQEQNLRLLAQNLPVEFPGWKDPAAYLATADVVLCTSLHESWGASIVEALAAGVPVVAPDVGVAKEAGATIAPRGELYQGVLEALASGTKGRLQTQLLDKNAWAKAWTASL